MTSLNSRNGVSHGEIAVPGQVRRWRPLRLGRRCGAPPLVLELMDENITSGADTVEGIPVMLLAHRPGHAGPDSDESTRAAVGAVLAARMDSAGDVSAASVRPPGVPGGR
jgi:hypothetical protein